MVEKIKDKLDITKNSEKLDLRNDPGYKLLKEKFGKINILDKDNRSVNKDNLLDFYKKIKEESFNQIDEVLKNSKSNVVRIFGSKEKFEETVFKEYLESRISDREIKEKSFFYWKDYLSGLLELNYKDKEDFKNAFKNFYLGKKDAEFIKDIWGNEDVSWQEAKKLYSIILFSFSSDGDFRNIKGKIKPDMLNLFRRIDINDIPYFFDKASHEYLKNYGLVDKNGKIDINVLLSLIGLVQNISDDVINQNLKNLNLEQRKDIIAYSLLHLFPEKSQEFLKKEIGTDNIVFLIKNLGIQNSFELLKSLLKDKKGKNNGNIDSIVGKYSIFISEKNKGRFLDIIKKFDLDYSESNFEASKIENIKKFMFLFTDSNFDKNKFNKSLDLMLNDIDDISDSKKDQIKVFLEHFFTGKGIKELKEKLYKGEIVDPISYILNKLTSNVTIADSSKNRQILNELKEKLYNFFNKYADKLIKNSKTETILSSNAFKKVEKDLELNSKGKINPYQASIVAYYACEYAVKNNNGVVDNNVLRKKEFAEYLKQKVGIKNKEEHRQDSIFLNNQGSNKQVINMALDQIFSDDFLSNFSLSKSYEIDKETMEKFKQDQVLLEKIQEYKQMGYEGYIRYMEQIENEKKLLKEMGTISKEISANESLLFSNSKESSDEIEIKSMQIGGVHIIESKLPGTDKIIQVESLTKEDANKELLKELTKYQFGIKISFDNWTPDDFGKLINTDITKGTLTSKDLDEIKEFYQVYAVNLLEKGILPKDFLSRNGLKLKDVYDNFPDFAKYFSEWMKNHMSIGGLKPIGTEFELDKFDPTVKKVIDEKYKWSEIKEKILDNQNDYGILEKAKGFIKRILS